MRRRWNEVNTPTHVVRSIFIVAFGTLVLTTMTSCGGDERHADRLWRQAMARVEKGDTQGAVDRLQQIIDTYPDSSIATKAREQIVVYRGLASAVQSYPSRRARELMVSLARAIEKFRRETGRVPSTLDELVPARLTELPRDPWDRAFNYETDRGGYRLICRGSDGAPGGDADAADIVVENGEFRADPP